MPIIELFHPSNETAVAKHDLSPENPEMVYDEVAVENRTFYYFLRCYLSKKGIQVRFWGPTRSKNSPGVGYALKQGSTSTVGNGFKAKRTD